MNSKKKKSLYKVYNMSDTEEVVIRRAVKEPKNTKPEIAREKLKEKRERLKKEKENFIIEEAKKRLASETEKKAQEEALAKQQEEEKKKADPTYMMMKRMEEMMAMFQGSKAATAQPSSPEPVQPTKAKRASKKKPEPEPEPEVEEKPKRKPRVPKEPKPVENVPKRRKKVVYLQQDPVESKTNQFVGYDIAPPAEPIQYQPSSGLLSALMGRRNMNSIYT
jgi:hypothetical protein